MKNNKLLNVYWTYDDNEKAFAFDLIVTKENERYITAKSNLYGDIYRLCKYTCSLEINGEYVGFVHKWYTETV